MLGRGGRGKKTPCRVPPARLVASWRVSTDCDLVGEDTDQVRVELGEHLLVVHVLEGRGAVLPRLVGVRVRVRFRVRVRARVRVFDLGLGP